MSPLSDTEQAAATERPTLQQVIDGEAGNQSVRVRKRAPN